MLKGRTMDTSNFFIYPSDNANEHNDAITFLEKATDDDW